jgi:hypothetical protein
MKHVEQKTMEVSCDNHKEQERFLKEWLDSASALRKVQSMGGIQMQTKYKIYTTYILESSCLISKSCPMPSQNVARKS